ncbi:hypothetical protein APHAL10511_004694 [Amanita phalloides]|nr:hypothetical protein APHAL10511_004694 [Amanita phalloides]
MVSSTGQSVLNLIGWAIGPDFVTHHVLRIFYSLLGPKFQKQPGSLAYRRHYSYAFSFVVLSYLAYNLIQGIRYMPPSFYQILHVPPTVDDAGLKLAFRRFAKYHHPDRPEVGSAGTELFMRVRHAFDALKNPNIRFAYDRFGPTVLLWKDCTTPGDYIRRGLIQSAGYHAVVGAALLFWSTIGQPSPVSFWRYILYATLFMAELVLVLSPSPHPTGTRFTLPSGPFSIFQSTSIPNVEATISPVTIFHTILPSHVVYQHIQFLHQVFILLSVALSRVAPQFFPQPDPRVEVILLDQVNALLAHTDREASVALHTSLHSVSTSDAKKADEGQSSEEPQVTFSRMRPISNPAPSLIQQLSKDIENMVVEVNVRKDEVGPLRAAWEAALGRKRKSNKMNDPKESSPDDHESND